jgi:ribose transport system substrate-binding protein
LLSRTGEYDTTLTTGFGPTNAWVILMKPLRILALPAIVLGLSMSIGCPASSGKPKVAFVSNNPATFWTIAEAGCRKAEGEFGVEVVFRKPAKGDPAAQTEILDSLKNQNIKAIAVSVIDPEGQRDHLREIAAKIPLITQDNDAPGSDRLCYIGTNNYLAGRAVGEMIKEAIPNGGTIAIFVGQLEPLNARQRCAGVLDELAGKDPPADQTAVGKPTEGETFGKYKLSKVYTDQPEGETKATRNATAAITQLKGEKDVCFIGLWAYNPPTILTAVNDKEKSGEIQPGQIKIVGFDEDKTTLQGIADGHIHGTVVQDPFNFGYEAVRIMASLAKGDRSVLPKNGILDVKHRIITKEGGKDRIPVQKFQQDLDALLGQK